MTSLQAKDVVSADFSTNLMTSSQEWESGQVADVFFAGVLVHDAEDGAADSSVASGAAYLTYVEDDAAYWRTS